MRMTLLIHIAGGSLGIVTGYVALSAAKGAKVHRRAGMIFVYSMLVMALTGATVAALEVSEASVVGGVLAAYLVFTGMTTVRRPAAPSRWLDLAPLLLALSLGAACVGMAVDAYANRGGMLDGVPAFMILFFGVVVLLAGAGDVRMIRAGGIRGVPRLRRHLWRMCYALWIATGSFFLGQADEFPEALRNPLLLFLPAFLPMLAMPYWLWRVGRKRRAASPPAAAPQPIGEMPSTATTRPRRRAAVGASPWT